MAITASSMIVRSLQMLGSVGLGATLTTAQQTDYLYALNSMLDSWSTERLLVYQLLQESLALTSGTASYTIGVGGAFNTTRPTKISDPCFIRDSQNADYPHLTLLNEDQFGRIVLKSLTGSYPGYLFYDHAYSAAGLATINLYPKPGAGLTLFINSWKALQNFATITTAILLPPGYQRAIESNLAIEIAAGYRPIPPETAMIAKTSKAAIMRINAPSNTLRLDPGVLQRPYRGNTNIFTG